MPYYADKNSLTGLTRGEKCLLMHLMVTIALILVLAIIYGVHLFSVKHVSGRNTDVNTELAPWSRTGVVVILGSRVVCGCALIRRRWSLAPAHCVAARSEPALAELLPLWRLLFHLNGLTYSTITRSTVHPHFSRSDFRNNIGLFKHTDLLVSDDYKINSIAVDDSMLFKHARNLSLMMWQQSSLEVDDQEGVLERVELSPLSMKNCRAIALAIVDLRPYEFCCVLPRNTRYDLEHGAVFTIDSDIKGFFSWGDKQGQFPLIMLDISYFWDWIQNVVTND